MTHKQFAKLLQDWRTRNNYSQRDAALALGCSKRTLQNWEQERAMPQGFGLGAMLRVIQGTKSIQVNKGSKTASASAKRKATRA